MLKEFSERPRPDMYRIAGYQGEPMDSGSLQYLDEKRLYASSDAIRAMTESARNGYQFILEFEGFSLEVLKAVDTFHSRKIVKALLRESDPKAFDNLWLVAVCELGSMLGEMFTSKNHFEWIYSWPYFNSIVVHTQTGWGIPVYDWGVKKCSNYCVEDGLAAKFPAAVEGVERETSL